eukprot:COSAG01_NODE_8036_length_2946_cov_5.061819_1_plen_45_part_10
MQLVKWKTGPVEPVGKFIIGGSGVAMKSRRWSRFARAALFCRRCL